MSSEPPTSVDQNESTNVLMCVYESQYIVSQHLFKSLPLIDYPMLRVSA